MIYPNQKITSSTTKWLIVAQLFLFLSYWVLFGFNLISSPIGLLEGIVYLYKNNNLVFHFLVSLAFILKCLFIATLISIFISYLSLIPLFKPIIKTIIKFRFLGILGLSFYILILVDGVDTQKLVLMVFAISTFLITAIEAEITSPKQEELDYAKTLGFNVWKTSLEINLLSRTDKIWEIMKQTFAIAWVMLPAIEFLAKSSGGIGVLLTEADKYKRMDWLWSIQFIILLTGIFVDWLFKVTGKFIFTYSSLYK